MEEIGACPHCECSITIYKTQSYKRFAKCEVCGVSYPLPKRGKLNNSALKCSKNGFPILIVEKINQPAYFWSDQPCFTCVNYDTCQEIKELIFEFKELKVYGY
ncbi:MAG: hypothetical protein ACFFA6_12535 [Promethearchaeota archaeon]